MNGRAPRRPWRSPGKRAGSPPFGLQSLSPEIGLCSLHGTGRGGVNGQGGTGSFGENRIRQILTHSDTGLMHEKKQAGTKRKGLQMPKKEAKHSTQRPGVDEERLT
jgi:hypothetical protein